MGNVLSFEIYGELKLLKKKEYGIFSKQSDLEALAQQLKKKVKGLLAVYGLLILGTILLFLVVLGLCVWAAWVMFDSGYISAR